MDEANFTGFEPAPVSPDSGVTGGEANPAAALAEIGLSASDANDLSADIDRRMCMRAYNHWSGLLDGRDCPSLDDLDPGTITEFAGNSLLLGFQGPDSDPEILYCGPAVREINPDRAIYDHVGQAPRDSLIGRVASRCAELRARQSPVGWDGAFICTDGSRMFGRGILLPLSSRPGPADMIYVVCSWRDWRDSDDAAAALPSPPVELVAADDLPIRADRHRIDPEPDADELVLEAEEPVALAAAEISPPDPEAAPRDKAAAEPVAPAPAPEPSAEVAAVRDAPAAPALDDQLGAARESAEQCLAADSRSRAALYRALSLAYDFALSSREDPERYLELIDEAAIRIQARAPMTAVVKLVFGADYDKTRLTEFAAALSLADRRQLDRGAFYDFIDSQPGGLKALVAEDRKERRPPSPRPVAALDRLRSSPPLSLDHLATNQEFALVVMRRTADGRHEPVSLIVDDSLVERAIRLASR